ncbi:MAG: hypothetical protein NC218_09630 [Acetobacter sp.]|nr:hypothetical protein [Acetobacter sp.]
MEDKFLNKEGVERLWAHIRTLLKESVESVEEEKVSMNVVDTLPTENIIPNMIYLVPVVAAVKEVADDEI